MKFRLLLVVFVFFSLFTNCQKKPTSSTLPTVTYLPLTPGNFWEYVHYDSLSGDSSFIQEEIGDTITLFGFRGYFYKSDLFRLGFIHIKNDTVILSDTSDYNQRRIFFINRSGVEADWELYSVLYQYEVRPHQEKKGFEVELKNGEKYQDCIRVLTRAHFPSGGSEELGNYFFAKNLGMLKFNLRSVLEQPPEHFELYRYNLK